MKNVQIRKLLKAIFYLVQNITAEAVIAAIIIGARLYMDMEVVTEVMVVMEVAMEVDGDDLHAIHSNIFILFKIV
jgi:hypothetical protein